MPLIIPPSPNEICSSISPRSASPTVEEAQEALSPNEDEDEENRRMATNRRKSSIWKKALNIKKKIGKVNMSLGEGIQPRFGATEGTRLPPIEVSPTSVEGPTSSPTDEQPTSLPSMNTSFTENVEKSIIQDLSELNVNTQSNEPHPTQFNDEPSVSMERKSSDDTDAEWKKRVMSQPKCLQTRRSDVSDELITRVTASSLVEGCQQSRPSDLQLFDDGGKPIPLPRTQSNRNQRLLSVPNIQYNRSISENTRMKSRKEPISIAANLMRRFSKYLICASQKPILLVIK